MNIQSIMFLPSSDMVSVVYMNYRGETEVRTIRLYRPWFGSNEYHLEPQWILDAVDIERDVMRQFALKDMHPAEKCSGKD